MTLSACLGCGMTPPHSDAAASVPPASFVARPGDEPGRTPERRHGSRLGRMLPGSSTGHPRQSEETP